MKKVLSVPYISQRKETQDPFWWERACGIFVVSMLLKYFGESFKSIDDLLSEGVKTGGYIQNVGWRHDALVDLARAHGVALERREYKAQSSNDGETLLVQGLEDIVSAIDGEKPVVVSVTRPSGSSHLAVVVGYDKQEGHKGFYIHDFDPDAEGPGEGQFVPEDLLKSSWRRLAIFCKNKPAK